MDILISHWHCIIPAVAILLALVLLQGKDTGKTKKNKELFGGGRPDCCKLNRQEQKTFGGNKNVE